MLKRQLSLNLNASLEANRLWRTIPDRCRQQVIEHYARLMGVAVKHELKTQVGKENDKDEHANES